MNNIKIKSNSLMKKTPPHSENIKIENVNFPFSEKKTNTEKIVYKDNLSNLKNSLVQHDNKLLISPSLNFESKNFKDKNKAKAQNHLNFKSLYLNFIEKQLQNTINSNKDLNKETNSKRNSYNIDSYQSDMIPNTSISQDKLNYRGVNDINNTELSMNLDKRINIKFNFNSEVINNNIKISYKSINDVNSINDINPESAITRLKETLRLQMDLLLAKDKQINSLKSELNNIKFYIKQNKTQHKHTYLNYLTSLTNTSLSKPGDNQFQMKRSSPALKFELELKNKIHEKTSLEIYSDRIIQNNSTLSKAFNLNENYKSASNNSSVANLIGDQTNSSIINNKFTANGKKMYFASHNCFRKSNSKGLLIRNPKSLTNIKASDITQISMNNFLKGCTLASNSMTLRSKEKCEENNKKGFAYSQYNLAASKSKSPVKKAFEDLIQSTIEKINKNDAKYNTTGANNTRSPNSSSSNSNLNGLKNPGDSESLLHKLTHIRNRASNALKIYSEFAVKRTNEQREE